MRFYHPTAGALIDWILTQADRLSRTQLLAAVLLGLVAFWVAFARVAFWVLS